MGAYSLFHAAGKRSLVPSLEQPAGRDSSAEGRLAHAAELEQLMAEWTRTLRLREVMER